MAATFEKDLKDLDGDSQNLKPCTLETKSSC